MLANRTEILATRDRAADALSRNKVASQNHADKAQALAKKQEAFSDQETRENLQKQIDLEILASDGYGKAAALAQNVVGAANSILQSA